MSLLALPSNFPFGRSSKLWWRWAILLAAVIIALAADLVTRRQVVDPAGQIYFVDGDCYARMTRVREVCVHPGVVMRHHDFENYPAGTNPHTTVPLDYLTAALRGILGAAGCGMPRDLAGTWISPLLGLVAVAVLWLWAAREQTVGGWLGLLLFAASPIVAHGFAYGRPDHQSLEVTCLAVALVSEQFQWRAPSRTWGCVSGVAWALGLWTSLYEPLIFIVAVVLVGLIFKREVWFRRERLPGLVVGGVILLVALACEGWRIVEVPGFVDTVGGPSFAAWSRQISELQSVPPWSAALYQWTGWGILAASVALLLVPAKMRPLARAHLTLLILAFVLTCWQVRWGYFLPLVYVLSLPVQFTAVPPRGRVLAAALLVLGCWPIGSEWWPRLHPPPELAAQQDEQREDLSLLRDVAAYLERASSGEMPPARGILAPWWLSPALAYWSRQPAVAGSSHESLPGIVDAARFYLAVNPREAAGILRERQVRWVVAYEPERIAATAGLLLGRPVSTRSMCAILYRQPELAPAFLRLALVNPYFKVYEVQPALLPPP